MATEVMSPFVGEHLREAANNVPADSGFKLSVGLIWNIAKASNTAVIGRVNRTVVVTVSSPVGRAFCVHFRKYRIPASVAVVALQRRYAGVHHAAHHQVDRVMHR